MSWMSFVHNPAGLSAVYQGAPPELTDVRLMEVTLRADGPTLTLRMDLPAYPDRPPQKWLAQGFNIVQIELAFSGLRAVTVEGFGAEAVANISLSGDAGVRVEVESSETHVSAVANTVFVAKMSAYAHS